jgi:NAD(P)H-hydrate epimerase
MAFQGLPRRTDVVVDAVLGTGLERPVAGDWAAALTAVNQHLAPVLAVDIPSGLHADTGLELGVAVRAALTVSFIALKQGMFTGAGPDCCGDIRFHGLQVPAVVYSREILAARRVEWQRQSTQLAPRPRDAHKGRFGHVLVVGGTAGFSGAARMTAEAALRCGAGLVSLATVPPLAPMMNLGRPEIMAHGVADETQLERLLEKATVVAVGPGLGQGRWAEELLQRIVATHLPLVMDADALNLLAQRPQRRGNWVLTPHPGEAARLLGCDVAEVQRDRFAAVRRLWDLFGGNVVLKGAGSVMFGDSRKPPAVCSDGNPGMASGGMGDVLTGLVAGFIAQGWDQEEAALMAVCLHAAAADACAAEDGERGMLATDLLPWCRRLLNREVTGC